jgi:hypothetical protein
MSEANAAGLTYFYMGDAAYRRSGVPGPHTIIQWAAPAERSPASSISLLSSVMRHSVMRHTDDAAFRWDQVGPERDTSHRVPRQRIIIIEKRKSPDRINDRGF